MGDHFVLLVDRLLTESTLEAAIESRNWSMKATSSVIDEKKINNPPKVDGVNISSPRKLVECRICQDEDEDSNMETPCSCCGSLKVSSALSNSKLYNVNTVYKHPIHSFYILRMICTLLELDELSASTTFLHLKPSERQYQNCVEFLFLF